MTIPFNTIPNDIRTPGAYIEFDNKRALKGLSTFRTRILLIGQRTSAGTVPKETLTLVTSAEQAASYFGRGSMLANMFKALKDNGKEVESYAIALDDDAAGVASSGSFAFSGTATENGAVYAYIAGRRVVAKVLKGDAAATIASALSAAINANTDLPVTASVSTATVTVTAKNKGINGNYIKLGTNFYGLAAGEKTPNGITVMVTQMANGATNPDIQDALDVLPDEVFDFIVMPYDDTANVEALETELASRHSGTRMKEGHAFMAKRDTVGNLSTFGNARNSEHVTCLMYEASNPTTPHEAAAMLAGKVAKRAANDPAQPHTGDHLVGMLPTPESDRFTQEERNTLLYDGGSTVTFSRDGKAQIDRVITTYQTNNVNSVDPSYLDVTTMTTLSYKRQDLLAFYRQRFSNMKIADDDTRITAGSNVTTPRAIRAAIIGRAQQWEAAGLLENLDQFAQDLIVERDGSDPTRVNVQAHPDLVNPLYILATQLQFIL